MYLNPCTHGQLKVEFSEPQLRKIATLSQHLIEAKKFFKEERFLQEGLNMLHCFFFQFFTHDLFTTFLWNQWFQHSADHVQLPKKS